MPLINHCNLIIPEIRLLSLSNHDLFGASSISRTRSSKYVGWLFGSSIGPLSLYYKLSVYLPNPNEFSIPMAFEVVVKLTLSLNLS